MSGTERDATAFLELMLTTLVENKALPKFQFERRIDAFLAPFLPEVLSQLLGGDILLVAPEFPLKDAHTNRSSNVDYLLFDHRAGRERWLLFELKTDDRSISGKQLHGYRAAMRRAMPSLLDDVSRIRKASEQKRKYDALLERLVSTRPMHPVELVFLSPRSMATELDGENEHAITYGDLAQLEMTRFPQQWDLLRRHVFPAM